MKKRIVQAAFVTAILILFVISFIGIRDQSEWEKAVKWYERSNAIITYLDDTYRLLADATTAYRGYILTSDSSYLDPYTKALHFIDPELSKLDSLLSKETRDLVLIDSLRFLIKKRLDIINSGILLLDTKGYEAAADFLLSSGGNEIMSRIRFIIYDIRESELKILDERTLELKNRSERIRTIFILGLSIGVIFLIIVFIALRTEIKKRTAAQEKVTESRNWFHTTLKSIGDAVIVTDNNGKITFMNPVAEEITGWKSSEVIDTDIDEVFRIFNEETREASESPIEKIKRELKVVGLSNHTVLIRKDGTEISIDDSGAPIFDSENNLTGIILVFRDITEKRKLELEKEKLTLELRDQFRLFDNILEKMPVQIYVHDNKGCFVYLNPPALAVINRKLEDIIGMHYSKIGIPSELLEQYSGHLEESLRTKQTAKGESSFEYGEVHSEFYYECHPILDENGEILSVITSAYDITERKKAAEKISELNNQLEIRINELENVNEELKSFIYTVSHDLRAPLRHIAGFLDLIKQSAANNLGHKEIHYINLVINATTQMSELIDNLLSFSRMGRDPLKVSPVDMNKIFKITIEELGPETGKRDIQWVVDNLPRVYGDESLLKIAVSNLVSNAVKYTSRREKAVIEIGFREYSGEYQFFIRDNGVGFNMQYADKLYNVFSRLHTDAEFEGTGIGLASVKKIIQKHGGRVYAEGNENEGATFYFTIPKNLIR